MAKWEPFFSYSHNLIIKCSICYCLGNQNRIMFKQIRSIIHLLKMTKQDNCLFCLCTPPHPPKSMQFSPYTLFLYGFHRFGLKSEFSLPWRSLCFFGWRLSLSRSLFQCWDSSLVELISMLITSFHRVKAMLVFCKPKKNGHSLCISVLKYIIVKNTDFLHKHIKTLAIIITRIAIKYIIEMTITCYKTNDLTITTYATVEKNLRNP